jgi:hypothetical protein
MRRTLCAVAGAALIALSAPAVSSADVLSEYQDLAARRLRPAPLVPTAVPPSLAPLDRTIAMSGNRRRGGYGLRMARATGDERDAVILLEGGTFKTLKGALRDGRRLSFRARRTRVRGHRGYLLTRHVGPTQWLLVWVEDRRVYTLGTGTPRTVSLKRLRATAAGLEHLGRDYIGAPTDPDNSSEGLAVTTERHVTVRVSWEATCVAADGSPAGLRVGTALATMLPVRGNAFTLDIAQHRDGTGAWSGTISGTISPAAIALTIHATGSVDDLTCDTGQLSFALDQRSD